MAGITAIIPASHLGCDNTYEVYFTPNCTTKATPKLQMSGHFFAEDVCDNSSGWNFQNGLISLIGLV